MEQLDFIQGDKFIKLADFTFSPEEKLELIEQKIHMLQERQMAEEMRGSSDPLTGQLMDLLAAAKVAHLEKEQVEKMTQNAERDDSE